MQEAFVAAPLGPWNTKIEERVPRFLPPCARSLKKKMLDNVKILF